MFLIYSVTSPQVIIESICYFISAKHNLFFSFFFFLAKQYFDFPLEKKTSLFSTPNIDLKADPL